MSEDSHDFDLKPNTFSYAVFKTEGTSGHMEEKHEVLMSWEGIEEECMCKCSECLAFFFFFYTHRMCKTDKIDVMAKCYINTYRYNAKPFDAF